VATSAIDVSDGLLGDLGHILRRSGAGARIETALAAGLMEPACAAALDEAHRLEYVLAGGDDYELLFTAPQAGRGLVEAAARQSGTAVTRIGRIEAEPGLRLVDADGALLQRQYGSFDHFA
jgi:thiamine-monophosphate kinase